MMVLIQNYIEIKWFRTSFNVHLIIYDLTIERQPSAPIKSPQYFQSIESII